MRSFRVITFLFFKRITCTIFAPTGASHNGPQRGEWLKNAGLKISVVRAQQINNNHKWPNPNVVKLKGVEPALESASFRTVKAEKLANGNLKVLASLLKLGSGKNYRIGFEYRPVQSSLNEDFNQKGTETEVYFVTQPATTAWKWYGPVLRRDQVPGYLLQGWLEDRREYAQNQYVKI